MYRKALQTRPDDLRTLFEAARFSETPACWAALVDHAAQRDAANRLVNLFMRLRKPWRGDQAQFGIQFRRLAAHLSAHTARHLIRACNPKNRLWFARHVDFDVLWSIVVCGLLELREHRRAYDAVLSAGRGFLVRRDDPSYIGLSSTMRAFYTASKDWHGNDTLVWRTYGRASDLSPLIRAVWDVHVAEGLLPREFEFGLRGMGSIPVKGVSPEGTVAINSRLAIPFAGLIARHAQIAKCKRMLTNRFTLMPDLNGAQLDEIGAMLQALVIHYDVPRFVPMRTTEQRKHRLPSAFRPLAKCR